MDNMEDKIGNILGNPEMMQKIMAMAQALNSQPESEKAISNEPPKETPRQTPLPDFDPAILQRVMGMAKQSGVDKDQQSLLRALNPYLSRDRLRRLENAMRAAKMAKLAAAVLGPQAKKIR